MAPFARQARLLKRLGHPTRLRLLWMLRQDEACVCHLAAALRISQPAVSQHLMALRRSGAVARRRDGKNIYYRLAQSEIAGLLDIIDACAGGAGEPVTLAAAEECTCPRCQALRDAIRDSSGWQEATPALETHGEKRT